jgi:hypothetical protein
VTRKAQADGDGDPGARRSIPRFDPVAGMRAMADVQADGLRAAAELIERMVRSEPDGRLAPASGADASALVNAWTDLLGRTVEALTGPSGSGAVTADVATGPGPLLRVSAPGAETPEDKRAEVWLHNGSFGAVGPLTLHCGQLSDCEGNVLDGAAVRFDPPDVEVLPPRSNRAVVVSVTAPGSATPGTYRGTIQARGAPGLWLPLEAVIGPC